MSTKGTIADITTGTAEKSDQAFMHIYTECFDDHPPPVYFNLWEQGEEDNLSMTVCFPQDKALELADDLARWAADTRAWNAKEKL